MNEFESTGGVTFGGTAFVNSRLLETVDTDLKAVFYLPTERIIFQVIVD